MLIYTNNIVDFDEVPYISFVGASGNSEGDGPVIGDGRGEGRDRCGESHPVCEDPWQNEVIVRLYLPPKTLRGKRYLLHNTGGMYGYTSLNSMRKIISA